MKSLPKNTQLFADYFKDYTDSYVLIGGVATLFYEERRTGAASRATKDLDIVVLDLTEDKTPSAFLNRFKDYVKENGYSCVPLGPEKSQNFRFSGPSSGVAPLLIEIISKRFEWVPETKGAQRIEESEMSSIALSPDFYEVVKIHRTVEILTELGNEAIPIVKPTALILLKAYAYQNLIQSDRPDDRSKASKHIGDIARLAAVLTNNDAIKVSATVFAPLKFVFDQADQHFAASKLVNLGWKKNTASNVVVETIKGKISLI